MEDTTILVHSSLSDIDVIEVTKLKLDKAKTN